MAAQGYEIDEEFDYGIDEAAATAEAEANYEIVKAKLMDNPNVSFGLDLLCFLSREYNVGWSPPGILPNLFNVLGQFSHDIEEAAKNVARRRDAEIQAHFERLIKPPAKVDASLYLVGCGNMVITLLESSDSSTQQYFETVVYVARLSFLFYQRGVAGAPKKAEGLIHNMLRYFNKNKRADFYPHFQSYASKLIRRRSGNDA